MKSCIPSIPSFFSRLILLFFFISFSAYSFAEQKNKFAIVDFRVDEHDMTAMTPGTEVFDINGNRAGLVKITTNQSDFKFDNGTLGITKVEMQTQEHPAEIWVYLPPKTHFLTIQHPQLGKIERFSLQPQIESGRTYILEITGDEVESLIIDSSHSKDIAITTIPEDTKIFMNGVSLPQDRRGHFTIPMNFGKHSFRAVAPLHHELKSSLVVSEESDSAITLKLAPAYGYLSLPADDKRLANASVFVDDKFIGNVPLNDVQSKVASGKHKLRIKQKLYFPYETEFITTDTVTNYIVPALEKNSAKVKISVPNDKGAQIYLDGESLGTQNWNGEVEAGTHVIEGRKDRHYSTTMHVEITKDTPAEFILDSPKPMTGGLYISANQAGADVYIDGVKRGQTPFSTQDLLVGNHNVQVRKSGHRDDNFTVNIRENEITKKDSYLIGVCRAVITSSPSAHLSVDGQYVGMTPYQFDLEHGQYELKLEKNKYSTWTSRRTLDANTKDFTIKLHRNFVNRNEFYFQGGYTLWKASYINAGAGMFIANVNLEANYLMSLKESDPIYWTNSNSDSRPAECTYKPQGFNVKAGYGFRLNSRLRITPQVGAQVMQFKENNLSSSYETIAEKPSATSLVAGARISFAVCPFIKVAVVPEWKMALIKSEGFKAISEVSDQFKSYTDGIGVNLNFVIAF